MPPPPCPENETERVGTLVRPSAAVARLGGGELAVLPAAAHGAGPATRVGDKVARADRHLHQAKGKGRGRVAHAAH